MKLTAIVMLGTLAVAGAPAAENRVDTHHAATICLQGTGGDDMIWYAKGMVSEIFAAIHVAIDWRIGLKGCPAQALRIALSRVAPPGVHPKALAYAMPYEGSHIVILRQRFDTDHSLTRARARMAHVMAHEITHILQGIARHSEDGVMKAHWDRSDLVRMARKPLSFTQEDIRLVHRGLAARAENLEKSTPAGQ